MRIPTPPQGLPHEGGGSAHSGLTHSHTVTSRDCSGAGCGTRGLGLASSAPSCPGATALGRNTAPCPALCPGPAPAPPSAPFTGPAWLCGRRACTCTCGCRSTVGDQGAPAGSSPGRAGGTSPKRWLGRSGCLRQYCWGREDDSPSAPAGCHPLSRLETLALDIYVAAPAASGIGRWGFAGPLPGPTHPAPASQIVGFLYPAPKLSGHATHFPQQHPHLLTLQSANQYLSAVKR